MRAGSQTSPKLWKAKRTGEETYKRSLKDTERSPDDSSPHWSKGTTVEVSPCAELQRQIHDALRVQNPEWIEPNGECPTCECYESRFAELLRVALKLSDNGATGCPYQ